MEIRLSFNTTSLLLLFLAARTLGRLCVADCLAGGSWETEGEREGEGMRGKVIVAGRRKGTGERALPERYAVTGGDGAARKKGR